MSTFALVLAVGVVFTGAFAYLWRRDRSVPAALWAAGWLLLWAGGLFSEGTDHPLARASASLCGVAFVGFIAAGASAYAGQPIRPWMIGAFAGLAFTRASLHLVGLSTVSFALVLPTEVPVLLGAAWLVSRASRHHEGGLPERLLGPAFASLAILDGVDALTRASGGDTGAFVRVWLINMLALAMLQLLALVEHALARERRLLAELAQSRKLETLGRLAGGVAHDFNNQLLAILGNAELLRTHIASDPRVIEGLRDIEAAARHCAGLTEGLLTFARRSHIEPRPIDLAALLHDLERRLRALLPAGLRLEVHVEPGLPPVLADPVQMERVITNLVTNARDAAGERGAIRIEAAACNEEDGVDPSGAGSALVELIVSDDGGGMDATTRERIFDPFFTTKSPGRGTGLGLAVVYGIVTTHGGSVSVDSAPGAGTTFRVRWPADANALPASEKLAPSGLRVGGETVLVVDDEPAVRAIARRTLEARGFTVIEAEDGMMAEAVCREHKDRIDAALLDLSMPGLDGVATLRALRQVVPELPAVLMSGDLMRADSPAPDDVPLLAKPFGVDDLVRTLRATLDARGR